MITLEKLEIFVRYSKDIDYFTFSGSDLEKTIITGDDWALINDLVLLIQLANKGQLTEKSKPNINKKLTDNCDTIETQEKLRQIALTEEIKEDTSVNENKSSFMKWLSGLFGNK